MSAAVSGCSEACGSTGSPGPGGGGALGAEGGGAPRGEGGGSGPSTSSGGSGGGLRGARHDEGGDDLAPAVVGQADDRNLGDARVAREGVLDLDRIDVLAAGDDHVVDPPGHPEVAVLVEVAGVAGEVPAFADRAGGRVRAVVVAAEGFVRGEADDDLAGLAGRDQLGGVDGRLGVGPHDP